MFFVVKTERGMVLGAFVSRVGFGLGAIGGTAFFDFGVFFVGELRDFRRKTRTFGGNFFLVFFFTVSETSSETSTSSTSSSSSSKIAPPASASTCATS